MASWREACQHKIAGARGGWIDVDENAAKPHFGANEANNSQIMRPI
jgi:hypothetical protein